MALATLLIPFWGSQAGAQNQTVPAQMAGHLAALGAWVDARTPVQQKIDSNLLLETDRRQARVAVTALSTINSGVDVNNAGMVLVDIDAQVTPDVLDAITAAGGTVVSSYPQYSAIRARLPLGQVEGIAARPEVRFVKPYGRAIVHAGPPSEGDVAHKSDQARTTFGVDGSGITVGVLSDSVDLLATLQASGDLPPACTGNGGTSPPPDPCSRVLPGQSGTPGSSEGTAMMEIVYDLAPGANQIFATAFAGEAAFAQNILNLATAGAKVIVDDVGYFAEAVFQDDIIAQAVDTVAAAGVAYFSSAGNSGNKNDGTSGVYQGTYLPGVALTTPSWSSCHNFGAAVPALAAETNQITSNSNPYTLQWADPLGQSSTDYDLFLMDPTFSFVVASSTNTQNGTQDPYEQANSGGNDSGSFLLVCQKTTSPSTGARFLHLNTWGGRLEVSTDGQTAGHSAALGAISVAAVDAAPGAGAIVFTGTESVETFSSDGPRKIFFDTAGNPVGPVDRQKPDIAAADGVTTASGFSPFFGTSAAAPHAAAIAALMFERGGGSAGNALTMTTSSSLSPPLPAMPASVPAITSTVNLATIRSAMTSTALDIEGSGVDRDSGYGIIDAVAAVNAITSGCPPVCSGLFIDDPLVPGTTLIRAVHFTELRTRINVQLVRFSQPGYPYTNGIVVGAALRAEDLLEKYAAVNTALGAAMQSTIGVPAITPGTTVALASHINALRAAVLTLEGL